MTVKEYALQQLPEFIRNDPWIQAIMLAGGEHLDQMAERILAIYNANDFDQLALKQVQYYEKIMGLSHNEGKPIADRRAAIRAKWATGQPPTLKGMQAICDAWQASGVVASYDAETQTIHLKFVGELGIPPNVADLKQAVALAAPAHLAVNYDYRYLLIKVVHNVLTIGEMNRMPLKYFAGLNQSE